MKKAGIFAAVIAAVLIFLQLYSYKLLGYTPEILYTVPENALLAAFAQEESAGHKEESADMPSSLELKKLEASSPYYKRGKKLYIGREKDKAAEYPLYKEDGAGVYTLAENIKLVNTEFNTLPAYEWMYVSGGTSYNRDGSQADPDEFILMELGGGLFLNVQEAVITGRPGNRIALLKENSMVRFTKEQVVWYEFFQGELKYQDCTQLYDADITIGSLTLPYLDFLQRLDLFTVTEQNKQGGQIISEESSESEEREEEPEADFQEIPLETAGISGQSEGFVWEESHRDPVSELQASVAAEEILESIQEEITTGQASGQETNPFFPKKDNSVLTDPKKKEREPGSSSSKKEENGSSRPGYGGGSSTAPTVNDPWGRPGEGEGGEGEGDGEGDADYFRMPEVTINNFEMGVYTAFANAEIKDPDTRIVKGIRIVLYRDGRIYMRKLIKNSGPVVLEPLPPDTYFEIEGYFDYLGRGDVKETYYFLKKQKLPEPTKKVDELNKIGFTFETDGTIRYADRLLIQNMQMTEEPELPPATPDRTSDNGRTIESARAYIQVLQMEMKKKAFIGTSLTQNLDSAVLSLLKGGQTKDWLTMPVLDSNSAYELTFKIYDRFGNELQTSPASLTGIGKTSKKQPKAQIQFEKNSPVGEQGISITINNKDNVEFYRQNETGGYDGTDNARFYMVDQTDLLNPIELDVTGDGQKSRYVDISAADGRQTQLKVHNLLAGHVYYGIVMGTYDLQDGSFYKDVELGRGAFTTTDLSSLGNVSFLINASNVTSTSADVSVSLKTEIIKPLVPFIKRMEITFTDQDLTPEVQYRKVVLEKEELNRYFMNEQEYEAEDKTGEDWFGERTVISRKEADEKMTVWEALLSDGIVKIHFPENSMKSKTGYLVTVNVFAYQDIEGAEAENVSGKDKTGTFKTRKLKPVVSYENMLVTNSFAKIYKLNISDPDGAILNGNVRMILKTTDNGVEFSSQDLTVDQLNGMDSFDFKFLSSRVSYQLGIYGIRYNEGYGNDSEQKDVLLQMNPVIAFETGTTIDGDVDISSYTDIYGGVIKGKNLFDPNDAFLNTNLNVNTGAQIKETSTLVASAFIPVEDHKTYLFSGSSNVSVGGGDLVYYDKNKNYIGKSLYQFSSLWRVDEPLPGAAYVRFRVHQYDLNAITYCELDEDAFSGDSTSNLFHSATIKDGVALTVTGMTSQASGAFSSDYIRVTGGKKYVKLHARYNTGDSNKKRIAFYDKNKNFISYKDFSLWYGTCRAPFDAWYARISADDICEEDLYFGEISPGMYSDNLFDINTVTQGAYLSSTGGILTAEDRWYSDYIPAEAGAVYSKLQCSEVIFYDKYKTCIESYGSDGPVNSSFIAPAKAAYFRLHGGITVLNQVVAVKVMPSAGGNDLTARISVNLVDKESYLIKDPRYRLILEKKDEDGVYHKIDTINGTVTVEDGKVKPVSGFQDMIVERSASYRVSMEVNLFDQKRVVLDQTEFRTADPKSRTYIIRSETGLAAVRSDPFGTYLAVNDIVNSTANAFSNNAVFRGILDFQGHSLTRIGCKYMFSSLGRYGQIKNMVLHVETLEKQTSLSNCSFLVNGNSGTISNIVADFKVNIYGSQGNIGGLCFYNYITGVIENFSFTLLDDFYGGGQVGLAAITNRGVVRNGYVYDGGSGYKIDTAFNNTNDSTRRGGIVGFNEAMGVVENVFSLVSVDVTSPSGTYASIGTLVGNDLGLTRNAFTTADAMYMGTPLLSNGPAIGIISSNRPFNVKYVRQEKNTVECYQNTFNTEAKKDSLRDPVWYEETINQGQAFDTSLVTGGFYPRLKMPEELVNSQPMMRLPADNPEKGKPVLTSVAVTEQRDEDADVEFVFYNPDKILLRDIVVSAKSKNDKNVKEADCLITDQYEEMPGEYRVKAVISNPKEFCSIYYISSYGYQNGNSQSDISYEKDINMPVYLSFYDKILSWRDWQKIVSKPDRNYRICADIDFDEITDSQMGAYIIGTFTGKIDGSYETADGRKTAVLKNIRTPNGYMISSLYGSISNLRIDGIKLLESETNNLVGFVKTMQSGCIDNVQINNAIVRSGYRAGVLVGSAQFGTIKNCGILNSVMESKRTQNQILFGGLAGSIVYVSVKNCFTSNVTMNITSALFVQGAGGMIGGILNGHASVMNCVTQGTLKTNYSNAGGIIGTIEDLNRRFETCISKVDIISNGSGFIGGILGTISGNGDIGGLSRNLSVGDLYSAGQNPEAFRRICGYNNNKTEYRNLAYSGQIFKGGVDESDPDDADFLVNAQQLKMQETYTVTMDFDRSDYEFAYEEHNVPMGIEQGYLPLLKNCDTGEVLENQTPQEVLQEEIKLTIEALMINNSVQTDFEDTFGHGAVPDFKDKVYKLNFILESDQKYVVVDAQLEGMEMNATYNYNGVTETTFDDIYDTTVEGKQRTRRIYPFLYSNSHYDRYRLTVKVTPEANADKDNRPIDESLVATLSSSYDLLEADKIPVIISTASEWNEKMALYGDSYANVELRGNINGAELTNGEKLITGVKVNSLFSKKEGGYTIKNIEIKTDGKSDYSEALIREVTNNIQNINFENISIDNLSVNTGNKYVGVIGILNGSIHDSNFSNITIMANGDYVGCIGTVLSSASNIKLTDIKVLGKGESRGGLAGSLLNGTSIEAAGSRNGDSFTYQIEGGKNAGGIAGQSAGNLSDITLDGLYVKSTSCYVGGAVGTGNVNTNMLTEPEKKSGAASCVVTGTYGVGGVVGYGNAWYIDVDSCSVSATTGNYAGGAVGLGINIRATSRCITVKNSVITGPSLYVGGVIGQLASQSLTACSVENCVIIGRSYVGGIGGQAAGDKLTVSNTYIYASGPYAGGLGGDQYSAISKSSVNNCSIYANSYVGGLAGKITSSATANNTFDSSVSNTSIQCGRMTADGNWASYAGGIAGYANKSNGIYRCTVDNRTSIDAEGHYVGGLAGYVSGGKHFGNAVGAYINQKEGVSNLSSNVGGLAGGIKSYELLAQNFKATVMYNSYFTGKVNGQDYVGGLFGNFEASSEKEAPQKLLPDQFYGLVMAGDVNAAIKDFKPSVSYLANRSDGAASVGTVGYGRIRDGSQINGISVMDLGLSYLDEAENTADICMVTSEQLSEGSMYFNTYADKGLNWSKITSWSDGGLLPLYGYPLKVIPSLDGAVLTLYDESLPDGVYNAVISPDYISSDLYLEYDGIQNTRKGHDPDTRVWENLAGNSNFDMRSTDLLFNLGINGQSFTGGDGWTDNAFVVTTDLTGKVNNPKAWFTNGSDKRIFRDMTITATFRTGKSGTYTLAGFGNWQDSPNRAGLAMNGSKVMVQTGKSFTDSDDFTKNVIHNATATFSAEDKTISLYVDGILKQTVTATWDWTSGNFQTGFQAMMSSNGYLYKGELFNTKLYTRCLNQDEVMHNYRVDMKRFDQGNLSTGVKQIPVVFQSGSAKLDLALLGLESDFNGDLDIRILSDHADPSPVSYGTFYSLPLGRPFLDYSKVEEHDGFMVPQDSGMYSCGKNPVAEVPVSDSVQWYRSGYPGYCGSKITDATGTEAVLAGRGYYYATAVKGGITYYTPIIYADEGIYMPYIRDAASTGYPILNGQEGYNSEEREDQIVLPDTYAADGSHQKTEVPDFMNWEYTPHSTTDQWYGGGIEVPGASAAILPLESAGSITLHGDASSLPSLVVYPSGADTVNLEFDETYQEGDSFAVYSGNTLIASSAIGNRVYTMCYDYKTPLKVTVSNTGGSAETREYSPVDLKRTVMVWKDCYYYLNEGSVCGNGENPKGLCVNLYAGKALMSDGTVIDLDALAAGASDKKETIETNIKDTKAECTALLNDSRPLYETIYDNRSIKAYERFSQITDANETTVRDLKLLADQGRLFGFDTEGAVSGSIVTYEYLDNIYMGILQGNGQWQNLGDAMNVPSGIAMTGIAHTSQSSGSEEPWLLFRYENGTAKGFNYVTGEELEIDNPKTDSSLIHYAAGYLSAKWESLFGLRKEPFAELKQLEKELTVYPLDDSMLIDGDGAGETAAGEEETEYAADNGGTDADGGADVNGGAVGDGGINPNGGAVTDGGTNVNGGAVTDGGTNVNGGTDLDRETNASGGADVVGAANGTAAVNEGPREAEPISESYGHSIKDDKLTEQNQEDISDLLKEKNSNLNSDSAIRLQEEPISEARVPDRDMAAGSIAGISRTAVQSEYVYVYDKERGGCQLYKAQDLLSEQDKGLMSEEEKLEKLKEQGIMANFNRIEKRKINAVSEEAERGLAVFFAFGTAALLLAAYVVRRKRRL